MLDGLLANVGAYVHTNPWLALLAVFLGGALTASNPCVLAMIPLMMGFVAGRREEGGGPWRAFGYSLAFVLGLALTFTALGVGAALAGSLYGETSGAWNWVVAAVCLLMGLHLMGAVTVPMPQLGATPRVRGVLGAFVLGLLFGFVSMPCAAPILVVLLTYLAGAQASVTWGAILLLVYALGHSLLILVAGTSAGLARRLIESARVTRLSGRLRQGAGLLVLLVGAFFAWSALSQPQIKTSVAEASGPSPEPEVAQAPPIHAVVFLDKERCCDCTRRRQEATWKALMEALAGRDDIEIRRLHLDTEAPLAQVYLDQRPTLVPPGLYFLDAEGRLVDHQQGELSPEAISRALGATP